MGYSARCFCCRILSGMIRTAEVHLFKAPCPTVFVVVCDVTSYNKYRDSTCTLTNRTFCQRCDSKCGIVRVLNQARCYAVASGCNTPTTNLDAPTSSSQNIKDKRSDWPNKKHATPYRIRMLPLLNCRGWKQLVLKNVYTYKTFCAIL